MPAERCIVVCRPSMMALLKRTVPRTQHKLTSCPPGIGWKMDKELTALGVTSANDLRSIPLAMLTKTFGERTAKYMYASCRGEVRFCCPAILGHVHLTLVTQCWQIAQSMQSCTLGNLLRPTVGVPVRGWEIYWQVMWAGSCLKCCKSLGAGALGFTLLCIPGCCIESSRAGDQVGNQISDTLRRIRLPSFRVVPQSLSQWR